MKTYSAKSRSSILDRPGARLWLALRFNHLSLQALSLENIADKPVVITEQQRVIYRNELARSAGVRYGVDVTTAKLLSNCESYERDS